MSLQSLLSNQSETIFPVLSSDKDCELSFIWRNQSFCAGESASGGCMALDASSNYVYSLDGLLSHTWEVSMKEKRCILLSINLTSPFFPFLLLLYPSFLPLSFSTLHPLPLSSSSSTPHSPCFRVWFLRRLQAPPPARNKEGLLSSGSVVTLILSLPRESNAPLPPLCVGTHLTSGTL